MKDPLDRYAGSNGATTVWNCLEILMRFFPTISDTTLIITTMDQIHFTGESACPSFSANLFRKDVCNVCQSKIASHSGATEQQIVEALEYTAKKGENLDV